MRRLRWFFVLLSNVFAVVFLVALVAGLGWGAWQVLPESSRASLRDPRSTLEGAQRGVQSGPANPLTALVDRVREWFAERRDLVDTVRTADGTSAGLLPLPAWTSVDERRVFGTTETLWQSRRGKLSGARWSRVVFSWSDIQPRNPREWRAGLYLRDDIIRKERNNGLELVGLLMTTPGWASVQSQSGQSPGGQSQSGPSPDGGRAVPAGLHRPVDDPQNLWATFVRHMAADYRGRIDTWIVWNEPDIRPGDPNDQYYSWAGDERDYARLLTVASLAAKQGNPRARIVFASTTYWADQNAGRPLFLERVLGVLAEDPEARARGFGFDAVGLNLYTSPDDLGRVAGIYRSVLDRYGSTATLWLTETNAVPYDDPGPGLAREQNGFRVTLDQQASYVVQAFAMGLASGYERLAFHSLVDRDTGDELWGLVRNDGTLRPSFIAYQTATRYFGGAKRVVFAGRERSFRRWPPGGFLPNWQIYLVVLERDAGAPAPPVPASGGPAPPAASPASGAAGQGRQRVSVLWNGDAEAVQVTLPRLAERAALVDKYGRALSLEPDGDRWRLMLPGATAHSPLDPEGFFFIGGDPVLLVEEGVAEDAPIAVPDVVA